MINILVVDDHALVRTGLKRMLDDEPGFKVIGEARTGEEAINLTRQLKPDVVLMDIQMPGIGGLEATRRLLRVDPDLKVVIVTTYDNDVFPTRMIQAGALGYLTKGTSMQEMVRAIRMVHAGQRYISPDIANQIALKSLGETPHTQQQKNNFNLLSERELQVMLMITNGVKVHEISERLHLSPKTVNSYRYRIFEKLHVRNDVELTHLAIQYGLLDASKLDEQNKDS